MLRATGDWATEYSAWALGIARQIVSEPIAELRVFHREILRNFGRKHDPNRGRGNRKNRCLARHISSELCLSALRELWNVRKSAGPPTPRNRRTVDSVYGRDVPPSRG